MRFEVADYDAASERLEQGLGLRPLMTAGFTGASNEGPQFVGRYFAAEDDVGFVVETGRASDGFAMPEPESVYP